MLMLYSDTVMKHSITKLHPKIKSSENKDPHLSGKTKLRTFGFSTPATTRHVTSAAYVPVR